MRHGYLLRLALFAYLLGVPYSLFAAEEKLLSRSDPGYAFVESIQKLYCDKKPSHNCRFDPAQCKADNERLWRELFDETPSEDNLARVCERISTTFELPGTYRLLSDYYENVKLSAPTVGMDIFDNIRFGHFDSFVVNF